MLKLDDWCFYYFKKTLFIFGNIFKLSDITVCNIYIHIYIYLSIILLSTCLCLYIQNVEYIVRSWFFNLFMNCSVCLHLIIHVSGFKCTILLFIYYLLQHYFTHIFSEYFFWIYSPVLWPAFRASAILRYFHCLLNSIVYYDDFIFLHMCIMCIIWLLFWMFIRFSL